MPGKAADERRLGKGGSSRNTLSRHRVRRRRTGHETDVGGFGNSGKPRFPGEPPLPSLGFGSAAY
jgi:hypothetical protein